jgi:hypothetical protein
MSDYLTNNSVLVYIPLAIVFAYWLYRHYRRAAIKKRSFDDYYNDILNSDKYKVKGRSELD